MKQIARLLTLIMVIGVISSKIVWSATLFDKSHDQPTQNFPQDEIQKTLRDVAKERDVLIEKFCINEFDDLASLVKYSHTILVAKIIDVQPAFTEGGDFITTTYTLEIERLLKCDGPILAPFEFTGFGGIVYVNGHRAAYDHKSFDKLTRGTRHVIFLEWIAKRNCYILSGQHSGIFTIDENSTVQSLATHSTNVLRATYSGINLETLLDKVIVNK